MQERFNSCIFCGALGDSFGLPVECLSLDEIHSRYGEKGINEFEIDKETGKNIVSDDTQMTLFTLEGLILSDGLPIEKRVEIMRESYWRWFNTQFGPGAIDGNIAEQGELWKNEELYVMRSPGHACIDSLRSEGIGDIEHPINDSMGNGTVMRSAPFGFLIHESPEYILELSCRCAAITHGNPIAQIAAGKFSLMIYYILKGLDVFQSELESVYYQSDFLRRYYSKNDLEYVGRRMFAGSRAAKIPNNKPHLRKSELSILGEGWTAAEALGLAIYCVLSSNDLGEVFMKAANRDGDSDTIASIAGNLYGAMHIVDSTDETLQFQNEIISLTNRLYQISSISPKKVPASLE